MKEVATYSEKACTLFIESMAARVKAVAGYLRMAKAKIILINWVFSLCGLMAGCETIDTGGMVPGLALVSWLVIPTVPLIDRKDSPEMKAAIGKVNGVFD